MAFVTSLPELVTTIFAARMGAIDMAIGNLFGSNMFNIFGAGIERPFLYRGSALCPNIDPAFVLIATLGLVMTSLALIGNLARFKRRLYFIEVDALLLIGDLFRGAILPLLHGYREMITLL